MKRLIVADTGPLIIFAKSKKLSILSDLTSQILVTNTVMHECTADINKPGAALIFKAFEDLTLSMVDDAQMSDELLKNTIIDDGEKSAIALALSIIDQNPSILIDEVRGRSVARESGLVVIGSAGILLAAKQKGLIKSVDEILIEWKSHGYYLNDSLINTILIKSGERKTLKP